MAVELIKEDRRKLLTIMEEIVRRCELEALAVVTQANAEEVAFFTDIDTNVDIFCALAAASLDTATKVTNKMNHGSVLELVVIGDTGYTIMSPVSDKYILIGAGKDFYSLGKTILILREKVKEIPLTLRDKRATTTKRKACSHFCQHDELYCCICSGIANVCDICQTSIQKKQAEQKKLLTEALDKAKQMELEKGNETSGNLTFAFSPEMETEGFSSQDGQELFVKVMSKIKNLEGKEPSKKPVHQNKVNNKKTAKSNNYSSKKGQQMSNKVKSGSKNQRSKHSQNRIVKKKLKRKR